MTKKMTRTPWYPGSVKPEAYRPGLYERDWGASALTATTGTEPRGSSADRITPHSTKPSPGAA